MENTILKIVSISVYLSLVYVVVSVLKRFYKFIGLMPKKRDVESGVGENTILWRGWKGFGEDLY
jgi:hypothetical protein